MARNALAILIGLLVLGAMLILIAAAANHLIPGALQRTGADEQSMPSPGHVVLIALLNAGAALIAGYITATIAREQEIHNGLTLGIGAGFLALLFALLDYDNSPLLPVLWFVGPDDVPIVEALWYKVHLVVVPLPFVLIGVFLRMLQDREIGP